MIKPLRTWLKATLGACPRCMRRSFASALLAATAAATGWFWLGPSILTAIFASGALGLTLLWLAHLLTYTWKVSARSPQPGHTDTEPDRSRRAVIPTCAKIFIGFALATVLPVRFARADPSCGADEWCCRHDFTKEGNPCVKCCPKK